MEQIFYFFLRFWSFLYFPRGFPTSGSMTSIEWNRADLTGSWRLLQGPYNDASKLRKYLLFQKIFFLIIKGDNLKSKHKLTIIHHPQFYHPERDMILKYVLWFFLRLIYSHILGTIIDAENIEVSKVPTHRVPIYCIDHFFHAS